MALSTISGTTGITDATITSAKLADFSAAVDLNGVELILDANGNTSITADTDDRIDFKLGGVEHISINNSSGDTVIKPMVDAKDIVFQQYDGNKILEINDGNYVAISGAAAGPGELRFYEDTDLGSHYTGFKAGNATASVSYVLPLADGNSGEALTTNSSGVLSWTDTGNPVSADGNALGSASLEWSDLFLADSSTIQFGADQDTTLTHTDGTGLTLNSTNKLCFNDTSQFIQGASATVLDIAATDEIELTATLINVVGNFTNSGTIVSAGVITAPSLVLGSTAVTTTPAELNLIDGDTSRGTTAVASGDGILINDGGSMAMTNVDTVSTYFASHSVGGGNIVTVGALDSGSITSGFGAIDNGTSNIRSATITAETAFVPDASGGADLGTTALEFNDLFLNDSGSIQFGDDQDTTLVHTDGTGLTLNSTNKLCFNDASQFVQGISATVLGLGATDEIDLTATAIDINGTCDVSGQFSLAGTNVTSSAAELNYSDLATLGTSAASKVLSADANNLTKITGAIYIEEATLSFDATQDWDVRASPVAKVTLTANVTFDAPSNPTTGQFISIVCIQDGTGSRTIAWNAVFEFASDTAPTATTTASLGDMFTFRYNGAKWLEVGRNLALTLS